MGARDRILELLIYAYPLSGATIGRVCGLGSWRLYPALARLERDGLIIGSWADGPYPRRRLYRLREKGDGGCASGAGRTTAAPGS